MQQHVGRPRISPAGKLDKILHVPVTQRHLDDLFKRAHDQGYRYVADFVRDRLEIDLLDPLDE